MSGEGSSEPAKILFLALDSVDSDLIRRWAGEGLLPTFRSLFDRARWGIVDNVPGLYVGALWTCLYTGRSPAAHGRYWFHQLRDGTYEIRRSGSHELDVEPFWETLSRAGRRVAVIDIPDARPSQGLNGIHLVDWGTHAPESAGFRTWPPTLAREVVQRFGREPAGLCDRRRMEPDGRSKLYECLLARIEKKEAILRHFLTQGGWDLFVGEFSEAHCAGHQLWDRHEPADGSVPARDPLRDVYVAIDAAVGRLISTVGRDTRVVVLCTHGMAGLVGGNFLLDEVLRRLQSLPPTAKRRRPLDLFLSVWRLIPWSLRERLAPIRDPLVRWMDEKRASPDPTRPYFQIPHNDGHGAIRINLRGRDPAGCVEPGAEYDALCDTLSRDLMALQNAETGAPAVTRVIRIAELFQGPKLARLPDLLVEWSREAPIRSVFSEKTGAVSGVDPQLRSGDHKPDGLFFATGPGLGAGPLNERVSILDFAPTITTLLSVAFPAEGTPIRELLPQARA